MLKNYDNRFWFYFIFSKKIQNTSSFFFFFFSCIRNQGKTKKENGKWYPSLEKKHTSIKLALFTGYVSLLPRTWIITRPHDVDPTSKFSSISHSETCTYATSNPDPKKPKKKKNKNQKEKTRKRKEGRLTTSPQGAHCPEQPPPFTLTPTHPLFLLLPLSKFFDQNSRERKVKIK